MDALPKQTKAFTQQVMNIKLKGESNGSIINVSDRINYWLGY